MKLGVAIGGAVVLCAAAFWLLGSEPTEVAEVANEVAASPPEARLLAEELIRPEYRELSREETIELLRSRGIDLDGPSTQGQQP
jgi:hypothetical protein